ncbi:MAG: hypothetical protein PHT75_00415 [Bacilli bacterium]|nr:hypothetical protein [Bacilli bacterium]MDD3304582.1 hypothetical protein [Bacilli bacterium]MDD4053773.1 hypothetical protein [Bacilli bacterium]MDD4411676.1 hypothetical protein [Bacilli bacterium]
MKKYVKLETISLKNHLDFNEKWVQGIIEEDPTILGLGDLSLRQSEKIQPTGGRLDMLLQDDATNTRYTVELQLGKTDETHIIRIIEYWDSEQKRNSNYKYVAVIIAEDITSRFFNVISLFNGHIPLIAIQMKAIIYGGEIGLDFTRVLDLITPEEEDQQEPTDRNYWEKQASKETLSMVDKLFEYTNSFVKVTPKYNKHYIGTQIDGVSKIFVSFIPKKQTVQFNIYLKMSNEIDEMINNSDLEKLTYDNQFNYFKVRLYKKDIEKNKELIIKLMKQAFEAYTNTKLEENIND